MTPDIVATVWVAIGGGFGSVARYSMDRLITRLAGHEFPWGTFAVNILGSFLIGYLGQPVLTDAASFETGLDTRFLVAIGVFGGFTTFSAFSMQTIELVRDGKVVRAILYTVGSVVLCLGATALGIYAAGLGLLTPA
jgi:CrcB protein